MLAAREEVKEALAEGARAAEAWKEAQRAAVCGREEALQEAREKLTAAEETLHPKPEPQPLELTP